MSLARVKGVTLDTGGTLLDQGRDGLCRSGQADSSTM